MYYIICCRDCVNFCHRTQCDFMILFCIMTSDTSHLPSSHSFINKEQGNAPDLFTIYRRECKGTAMVEQHVERGCSNILPSHNIYTYIRVHWHTANTGYPCANFMYSLLGAVLKLRRSTRQTDRQTDIRLPSFYNVPTIVCP